MANLIKRQASGMGLPGSENGDLDLALKLHARDLQQARSTGKVVNDVEPNDPPATEHGHVYGGHHAAYARVMRVMGIADDEVYKNAASASGMRLPAYVASLHKKVVQHETSKSDMTHTLTGDEFWEHPRTKEIIPVKANHPDMPSAFTRSVGVVNKVTRGADGSEVLDSGYRGWDKTTARGGKGGKTVLRYSEGPTKGVDVIDHLRVQMLGEHGSSKASRKKGADIADSMAAIASGAAPRGMKRSGQRKVADKGFGTEKYEDTYVPATPAPKSRAFDKPTPPGVKGLTSRNAGRDTSAIQDGKYLLGSKPPADLPDFSAKGPRMVQPKLPGTGVPKAVSTQVTPAEVVKGSGPLEKRAYELEGTQVSKGSKFTLEDFYPKIETKPAVRSVSYEPTDRDFKPQSNPNRGQQFALDTTEMTGAQEVKAIAGRGELGSQKKAGKELVVRPGGKRQAKKDRAAAPKPLVQGDLFPDYSVKEGRKNAFYMAGSVKDVSESTKQLQSDSKKRFGRKEDQYAVEGKYSGADDAKLEQPEGSRADKKNTKKLDSES
jgi:hypothetical protein